MVTSRKQWLFLDLGLLDYREAWALQLRLVDARKDDVLKNDVVLFLEHPAVFTLGRRGGHTNLKVTESFLASRGIPLVHVERGGDITYHGPGQLVVYPVVHLQAMGLGVLPLVEGLEEIMIRTAADWAIKAERNPRNRGAWVGPNKIGSIGIAVRRSVSFHGLALNVNTDLEPFTWVNPCGLQGVMITSMKQVLGREVPMEDVKNAAKEHMENVFGIRLKSSSLWDILPRSPKPPWLKRRIPSGATYQEVRRLLKNGGLHTVCEEACCPNLGECFSQGTATFLILGDRCTRNCRFCAVGHGPLGPPDPHEPRRVAEAVKAMTLKYVVITSVTRDDLPDGGAGLFAQTILALREKATGTMVEVLIPDFQGDDEALKKVMEARPDVLNHNVETVPRLYPMVRPGAVYERSVRLLKRAREIDPSVATKSGLMLGLGESDDEIGWTLQDLVEAGCMMLTLGQYLQPSRDHLPVERFVPPEEFDRWKETALRMGFTEVASGPFVRSSYHARELYQAFCEAPP
jgi:lipoic acid synthetase